jgi:hypothetical protein
VLKTTYGSPADWLPTKDSLMPCGSKLPMRRWTLLSTLIHTLFMLVLSVPRYGEDFVIAFWLGAL